MNNDNYKVAAHITAIISKLIFLTIIIHKFMKNILVKNDTNISQILFCIESVSQKNSSSLKKI